MEENKDGTKSTFKPLVSKHKFLVQKIPDVPKLNRKFRAEKQISTWLFFNQGKTKSEVTFAQDVFKPNDTVKITCEFDNLACEKDLEYVKVRLIRTIKLFDIK